MKAAVILISLLAAARAEAAAVSAVVLDVTPWRSALRSTLRLEASGRVERWDFAAGHVRSVGVAVLAEEETRRLFALAKDVPLAAETGDRDGDVLLLARNGDVAVYREPEAPAALETLRSELSAATANAAAPLEGGSWVRVEPVAAEREQALRAAGIEAIPLDTFAPEGREALESAAVEPWSFVPLTDPALGDVVEHTDCDEFYVVLADSRWTQATLWDSP
ncbi:MAG: hypothetical protein ACT4PE_06700 [Candidatus Eiseniibacteriota bacterium]